MIVYRCAGCGETLETDDALSMQTEKCPVCGHINTVPKSRKELRRERREQREQRRRAKRAHKQATQLKLRRLQNSTRYPEKETELRKVDRTPGGKERTPAASNTSESGGGPVARAVKRPPHAGKNRGGSVRRVAGVIIATLGVAWVIGHCCGDSKELRTREATLREELLYLNEIEEIAWWEVEDNNVYIGFRELPSDWQWIIRGAALRGNKAIDFGCHVWAVRGRAPGWRPGDPGFVDQVTARYGRVR